MTPEQALIRIYDRAAKQLRAQLRAAVNSGALGTAAYQQQQLDRVKAILAAIRAGDQLHVQAGIRAYEAAAKAVDAATGTTVAFRFTGSNHREAMVIARNLVTRLDDAVDLVGRRTEDMLRKVALEEVGQGIAAGAGRREVSAAIARRLVEEHITDAVTGFVDRRGARWQLDTYARMVARTTTREAVSAGTKARMLETGQNLITISDHGTTTPICIPYEGGTYALPGTEVAGYETIDQMPPFHPNCQHVATPAAGGAERFLDSLAAELGVTR